MSIFLNLKSNSFFGFYLLFLILKILTLPTAFNYFSIYILFYIYSIYYGQDQPEALKTVKGVEAACRCRAVGSFPRRYGAWSGTATR